MSKKRITLRVDDNEIAIIGPIDRWHHLVMTYEFLAGIFPEDENAWLEAAAWIRDSITNTKEHKCRCSESCGC